MNELARTMPIENEAALQKAVIELARRFRWRVAHFKTAPTQSGGWATPVQADGKGFPDLVCVRPPRLLFLELKAKGKKPAPEQEKWLADLRRVEVYSDRVVEVHVLDPTDWQTGFIEELLR